MGLLVRAQLGELKPVDFLVYRFSYGAPSGARFSRVKVPNPPGSGKDIVEGKGVEGDLESEGSRM